MQTICTWCVLISTWKTPGNGNVTSVAGLGANLEEPTEDFANGEATVYEYNAASA